MLIGCRLQAIETTKKILGWLYRQTVTTIQAVMVENSMMVFPVYGPRV